MGSTASGAPGALSMDAKSQKRRELILSGNLLQGILTVCVPMAVFQLIQQFFRVFDLSITAHLGKDAVTAVSFFSQLSNMFQMIGGGFAMGAGIVIAGVYGAGDYRRVKEALNTAVAMALIGGAVISAALLAFAPLVLRAVNTPPELAQIGIHYYRCEMASLAVVWFNNVYIAVEKARGNGDSILWLNLILAAVKLALSAWFILVLRCDIVMISVSTLCANLVVAAIGVWRLRAPGAVFGLSLRYVRLRRRQMGAMMHLSLPVMGEKVAFSAGKVLVNAIGVAYGTQVVGALGISNTISSLTTMPPSSIGDGGAAIIRQNLGAGNKARALRAFCCILWINLALGAAGVLLTIAFIDPLVLSFAKGDAAFAVLVKQIFMREMLSNEFLALNAAVLSLLYGLGYTRVSFAINFSRLFVFRLPLLLALQHWTALDGGTVMGTVMMVSNALTGLSAAAVAAWLLHREFTPAQLRAAFALRGGKNA